MQTLLTILDCPADGDEAMPDAPDSSPPEPQPQQPQHFQGRGSRSMGSSMLPQREQVLLRGAGLGPSAKLQRPACWTPLPARRPARVQTLSQPASRLLAPARAHWQCVTRQAARGLCATPRQPQCPGRRMQLRVQQQVFQAVERLGKQVSNAAAGSQCLSLSMKAHALVLIGLVHMFSTFRLHLCCCPRGTSVLQPSTLCELGRLQPSWVSGWDQHGQERLAAATYVCMQQRPSLFEKQKCRQCRRHTCSCGCKLSQPACRSALGRVQRHAPAACGGSGPCCLWWQRTANACTTGLPGADSLLLCAPCRCFYGSSILQPVLHLHTTTCLELRQPRDCRLQGCGLVDSRSAHQGQRRIQMLTQSLAGGQLVAPLAARWRGLATWQVAVQVSACSSASDSTVLFNSSILIWGTVGHR